MAINVSKAFFKANSILNQNLGKYDKLSIIGVDKEAGNALTYLQKDILEGFYYKCGTSTEGDITEEIVIVPESAQTEELLNKAIMFELAALDGTFVRFEIKSKHLPTRPSFQWCFYVKPNHQDRREIS